MVNLRAVLSIMLSKIPPKAILKGKVRYDNITADEFTRLAGYYVKNYSNDELNNLYLYIQNEYESLADYLCGCCNGFQDSGVKCFNVFDAILIYSSRVLKEYDEEPVCQYEHLLNWRMTAHELDEDLFSTAFLAYKDIREIRRTRSFSWRPVLRHNNVYLNKILSQGMADNHFHLKGSAPQFPLSWLSIMNNVESKKNRRIIEKYSHERLSTIYDIAAETEHLYISCMKAALIRCFLFTKLTDNHLWMLSEGAFKSTEDKRRILEESNERLILQLICGDDEILYYRSALQANISYFKSQGCEGENVLDYMLLGSGTYSLEKNSINSVLSGERWFMYSMFKSIFASDSSIKAYYNLFYAYLVIKGMLRSELVQTNATIGFDNFEKYQNRKEDFVDGTGFEKKYLKMAVAGTIQNQSIVSLEARITPKDTAAKNMFYIKKFDSIITEEDEDAYNADNTSEQKLMIKKYFYVFHFIKEKDQDFLAESNLCCRHFRKRSLLRKQALAISEFREAYPKIANRVKGIDACAAEIGCRPEVFAQVYRFLSSHIVYYREFVDTIAYFDDNDSIGKSVGQLGMTYHVGEDYLDIVDGLRAVDEAVNFLRLDCGARLGHALVLGVDVEEYYKLKNNKILINQQDYLDNIVWLYYRIKKFGLLGYEPFLLLLEQEYEKYFRIIYGNYIDDESFYTMRQDAKEYFKTEGRDEKNGYGNSHFHFKISEYYAAWKLRGDNPEYYVNGYFEEIMDISEWNRYAINIEYPNDYKSRYNPECAYLYYLYHYSADVKREGKKVIEVRINTAFVKCVSEIQREFRNWICKKGVGIEVNPSSNYLIGSFRRYDKHPIFKFYNLGLTNNLEEIEECPQMAVCVNTDDQGIFSTYLENEYALLALALEKKTDLSGRPLYKRAMIYQWIDNVRRMGINLTFGYQLVETKKAPGDLPF